jgi:hypothetical protein
MARYDVPFYSQLADIQKRAWQYRGCGITALKMVLAYWNSRHGLYQNPPLWSLLKTGLRIGAYIPDVGWSHSGLVNIACQYGYTGFNRDLIQTSSSEAFVQLQSDLMRGPLLVSVFSGFDPDKGGGHIVVLTGVEDDLVFLNDPFEWSSHEGEKIMAISAFQKAFKRRWIAVEPKSGTVEP